jgi:hypothetical protein
VIDTRIGSVWRRPAWFAWAYVPTHGLASVRRPALPRLVRGRTSLGRRRRFRLHIAGRCSPLGRRLTPTSRGLTFGRKGTRGAGTAKRESDHQADAAPSARSGLLVAVGEIPARQRMHVLSRGVQTRVTSCVNRYRRRSVVQRRAPGAGGAHCGTTSRIGVSRCEQRHVVRQ